ncbi:RICIN domain-containing protein [Streptomyces sp. NBC_00513]|uniref:RICIN domain-containing protein n=1 Tax=unclassified Streptomyces TaxID=2593676 RepID=UPI002252A76C|nr:RICIN domain-containing protein [Streptomyces sp. NBC_00424]MCX5071387.1 RICIN domain-containing protein [Streptomyces sp. NBC_00424]WUD45203.1 RICIN domain-containing protein [Streptomyces sp. NBC_00513]
MSTNHHSAVSRMTDQQLCDVIRTADQAAPSAETELRRRHRPQVAAFAQAIGNDPLPATRAADRAMARFIRTLLSSTAESLDRPPRLMLLTIVSPNAEGAGHPAGSTSPASTGHVEEKATWNPALPSVVQRAFAKLPARTQAVLWHSVVEEEPDDRVAVITGDRSDRVPDLAQRALAACRDAFLGVHATTAPAPHCPAYARLLAAAAERADVRGNPDLTRHVDACPGCASALRGLVALRDTPRTLLASALLGPIGSFHLLGGARMGAGVDSGPPLPAAVAPARGRLDPDDDGRGLAAFLRKPAGRVTLGVATVLVTTVALAVVARPAWGPSATGTAPPRPQADAGNGAGSPAPSRTAPSPSSSASPRRSPRASPSAEVSAGGPSSSSPSPTESSAAGPAQPFRAVGYVSAVNSATGLCLDVRGGAFANGVDVITARCHAGAPAQQWRLDEKGLLHNAANPGFCMDARGSTGDGVGVWSCSALGKVTGNNLVFSTDAAGRIKPRIAPGYAVTSGSSAPGAPAVFGPTSPAAEQRWNESSGSETPNGTR